MKTLLLATLRAYKLYLSPTQPASCRFVPSCSEYAVEAIARHGSFYGVALAATRLVRCHPFSRGGLDLVPQRTITHQLFHRHQQKSQAVGSSQEQAGGTCS